MQMFNPPHPGEAIEMVFEDLGEERATPFSHTEIGEIMGLSGQDVAAFFKGELHLTPLMALHLAAAFPNSPADFWMRLQSIYDLAQAAKTFDATSHKPLWVGKTMTA
jgi:addiction module HigA family antidote